MTFIFWILPKPSAESRQKTNNRFTVLQNNKAHWITAFHVNRTHRVLDSSSSDLSLSPLLSPRHHPTLSTSSSVIINHSLSIPDSSPTVNCFYTTVFILDQSRPLTTADSSFSTTLITWNNGSKPCMFFSL